PANLDLQPRTVALAGQRADREDFADPWVAADEPSAHAGKENRMAHHQYQSCIQACYTCAAACDHCATACLAEKDVKMMARCIELDMDCAAICRLAAAAMARGSRF